MAVQQSRYKLVYFPVRGLAETSRLIFAYAGVEYEDVRIKGEEWPAMKNSTLFHSLPYLEVDGEILGQSAAIARFLAKRFNLAGNSDVEQEKVDALADYINGKSKLIYTSLLNHNRFCFHLLKDAFANVRIWFREADETKKAEGKANYYNEILPEFLGVLEEHLKKNGGGQGFFVGSGPTWVDFQAANFLHQTELMGPGTLDKYPLLKALLNRVTGLKGIKEYIAQRSDTPI